MKNLFILAISMFFLGTTSYAKPPRIGALFKVKKPIIGVVNIKKTPGHAEFISVQDTIEQALSEVTMLEEAGVDAVLFENPSSGGINEIDPAIVETMAVVVKEAVRKHKKMVIGVEVLWHNPKSSLDIAKVSGAKFIRTDFFSDEVIADGQVVNQDPKELIAYRKSLGLENKVAIFTDIQVKYSQMVDPTITMEQSAERARRNKSNGIIVTSHQSGTPPDKERLINAKKGAKNLEIIIGSGFSVKNVEELLPHTDAVIVGTSISTGTGGVVVKEKAVELMTAVKKLRESL